MAFDLRPGDAVFGATQDQTFTIIEFLGRGSFGSVYKVEDLGGTIAGLKTIHTAGLSDRYLKSLINEGNLASRVRHPNVVQVSYFHDGTQYPQLPPYMLMEFADEGTLEDILTERRNRNVLFDNSELVPMWKQLASGMKAVNEKLVHRDVKPDNILLANGVLKISDFGLSKLVGAATRSQSSTFKGIHHIRYCAPEAWRLDKNLPAMDMYSMGVVFYEMATLKFPYSVPDTGDLVEAWKTAHFCQNPVSPKTHNPALDANMAQLVMKMLSKRSEDRYDSWDMVINALERPVEESETKTDASWLVERGLEKQIERESARLEAEEKAQREREFKGLVAYAFNDIVVKAAKRIVDEFNKQSDFAAMSLVVTSEYSFSILRKGSAKQVQVLVQPLFDDHSIDERKVMAWGHLKAPSGKGFNLLLMAGSLDDLYGTWEYLQAEHEVGMESRDRRPVPFPFEFRELPEEIQMLRATHSYKTTRNEFEPGMIQEALAELL